MIFKLLEKAKEFILLGLSILLFLYINLLNPCLRDYFWILVANDILIGIIVSYIFYLIVVYVPNRKKETIIKGNYKKQINNFKSSIIVILLGSLTGGYRGEKGFKHEDLFVNKNFKDFFHVKISDVQDRWGDVANNLQDDIEIINNVITELRILEDESRYALNNLDIRDERVFVFLKNVSKLTDSLRGYKPDSHDVKFIMSFLWQIFAGWSWVDGYAEEDIFQIIYDEF